MSQAETLLNSLSEEVGAHEHSVPDTDSYFVIDPATRKIENTNRKKIVIMQYDHNSERFTFALPRYIDGHDMLLCTSITVNADNIESETGNTNSDAPDMTDLSIHPDDPDKVISSWLITRSLTQLAGILSFSIEYKCVDSEGNVVYEWSTDTYDEVEVKPRKKNGEAAVAEHTDLLEQWRTRIFGAGDSVMANITAEGEAQVAAVKEESVTQQEAVELKAAEALESIPEDYTEVNNMAEEAVRSKSDAIVCEAEGKSIVAKNSSDDHIRGLKLFGKSTQRTTTGKNLLSGNYLTGYGNRNGVEFTDAGDGKIGVNGTSTADTTFVFCSFEAGQRTPLPAGTYTVSGNPTDTVYLSFFVYSSQETSDVLVYNSAIINGNAWTFTIENDAYYGTYLYVGSGKTVVGVISPMLERGSAATDYEPYTGGIPSPNPDYPQEIESVGDPNAVTVKILGKNLLNHTWKDYTHNGITFTRNADASVTVRGTATTTTTIHLNANNIEAVVGETYVLTGCPTTGYSGKIVLRCFNPDNSNTSYDDIGEGAEFKFTNPAGPHNVAIVIFNGATVDTTFYPMLRHKSISDDTYEPYTASTFEIARSLLGIPVTSGGNYIDSDGQQWICDEVDLERGVYVQRVYTVGFENAVGVRELRNGDTYRFAFPAASNPAFLPAKTVGESYPGMCTSLINAFNPLSYNGRDNVITAYLLGGIYVRCDAFETVEEFVEWAVSTDLQYMYALATPIETPLTAEEITAFKALRTNYPNTTILNDAGAWMSVKYNADTKMYVENPKTLKLVDSSTGVVYELKIVDGNLTVIPV